MLTLQVFDALLADNFRVFSVEPNYCCQDGASAKDNLEFSFMRVNSDGHVCSPHTEHTTAMAMPHGC